MSDVLGSVQAEYAVSGVKNRMNLLVGRLLVVLGPLLLAYAVYRRLSVGSDGLDLLCGGIGLLLLLMGAYALWEQRRDRSVSVQVHDQGLVYARNGKRDVVRWDDVDAAVMSVTSIRGRGRTELDAVYGYTIRRQDGSEVKFRFNKNSIRNIDELSRRIQQEVTRRKLPQALATLQAGGVVQFGRLSVDSRGIANGKEHVPWNEIEEVTVRGGKITVRKKGKWLNWSNALVSDTPNVFVFLALVDGVRAHHAEIAQAVKV